MSQTPRLPTRERLIGESMKLFGSKGYAGTSVLDIEAAAGLSPGAGSLYRHFPSKEALLAEGVRQQAAAGQSLLAFLSDPANLAALPLRERLRSVARAGLRRLEQEEDFNRILIKDLHHFPELLAIAREDEVNRIHATVADWLQSQAPAAAVDWHALAAVVIGSISNFWLLGDIFGEHPAGITEERYVDALVEVVVAALGAPEPASGTQPSSGV